MEAISAEHPPIDGSSGVRVTWNPQTALSCTAAAAGVALAVAFAPRRAASVSARARGSARWRAKPAAGAGVPGVANLSKLPPTEVADRTYLEAARALDGSRRSTRPTVALCHGLLGFQRIGIGPVGIDYWRGIEPVLKTLDCNVVVCRVPPTASIRERAEHLARQLEPFDRVHLVGHSMGGCVRRRALRPAAHRALRRRLDCRSLVSQLGFGERSQSLTTLGTPHRGSSAADWGMMHVGERLRVEAALASLGVNSALSAASPQTTAHLTASIYPPHRSRRFLATAHRVPERRVQSDVPRPPGRALLLAGGQPAVGGAERPHEGVRADRAAPRGGQRRSGVRDVGRLGRGAADGAWRGVALGDWEQWERSACRGERAPRTPLVDWR